MQKNEETTSWLKNTWEMRRDNWIMIAGMWGRRILLEWWPPVKRNGKTTPDILRMVKKKEFSTNGIIREDNKKLEPRIFGRTGKIERKTLLRSSNVKNDNEKQHQNLLRHSGETKGEEVEPTMKRIWKRSWRRHVTDGIHTYVTLQKNLRIAPGK